MGDPPVEFVCPISLCLLDDPVSVPCCGVTFSRQSIQHALVSAETCPACRGDLSQFDVSSAAKNINILSLINQWKGEPPELPTPPDTTPISCSARLFSLRNREGRATGIGRLEIVTNYRVNSKTLLIPVIDKSGSMAGSPMDQVNYSVGRISDYTRASSQIHTRFVLYDDKCAIRTIDNVGRIVADSGTSFNAAFDGCVSVLREFASNADTQSAVILFLTDGEDCSVAKGGRSTLVDKFKMQVSAIWPKDFTVHTIGFGANHDFEFLDALRNVGTFKGAYRFADPAEDRDSLSAKINSIFDTVVTQITVPIQIKTTIKTTGDELRLLTTSPSLKRVDDDQSVCQVWVNLSDAFDKPVHTCELIGVVNATVNCEWQDSSDSSMWDAYVSHLVDELAADVFALVQQPPLPDVAKELAIGLLRQRAHALFLQSDKVEDRLGSIVEGLNKLAAGQSVSRQKLADMSCEGAFATAKSGPPASHQPPQPQPGPPGPVFVPPEFGIREIKLPRRKRTSKPTTPTHAQIASKKIGSIDLGNGGCVDGYGQSALIFATIIGRHGVVERLCEGGANVNGTCTIDSLMLTVLDLAAVYGYWKCYDVLKSYGARHTESAAIMESIFYTCLKHGYFRTCERLPFKITPRLLEAAPTPQSAQWLMLAADGEMTESDKFIIAVSKGVLSTVQSTVQSTNLNLCADWSQCPEVFTKTSPEYLGIVDFLLKNGRARADQTFSAGELGEITFPLFIACEHGNIPMVTTLLKYLTFDQINMRNHLGTTSAWIAACNKHQQVLEKLIAAGADVNIPNDKGSTPLLPVCQKGTPALATILLDAGIDVHQHDKERDNMLITCCRHGQAEVLGVILTRATPADKSALFGQFADIDGFNAMLAAAEADKPACIEVLHKHGDDIEVQTAPTNPIIAGATPLHVACYYNKANAARTLLTLGANVNARTALGFTPLHLAVRNEAVDVIKTVLKHGGDPELLDSAGKRAVYYASPTIVREFFTQPLTEPLFNACQLRCAESCAVLKTYATSVGCFGAKDVLNFRQGGRRPLTVAILHNNAPFANALMEMGGEMHLADEDGLTPAVWSVLLGRSPVMDAGLRAEEETLVNNALGSITDSTRRLISYEPANPAVQPQAALDEFGGTVAFGQTRSVIVAELRACTTFDYTGEVVPVWERQAAACRFDATIHLLKTFTKRRDLSPLDAVAIYLWTSPGIPAQVTNAMTPVEWDRPSPWKGYVYCLYAALSRLPMYSGEAYRFTTQKFAEKELAKGKVISWPGFVRASTDWRNCTQPIANDKGVIFIIKSQSGRSLGEYSRTPSDNEVVFLPGTKFKVNSYHVGSVIALGQANIRNITSYAAQDKDLEKASAGKGCLIVSVEEV